MDKIVAQALGQTRLMTWLLGIFAGVALLLGNTGSMLQCSMHHRTAPEKYGCARRDKPATCLLIMKQEMSPS